MEAAHDTPQASIPISRATAEAPVTPLQGACTTTGRPSATSAAPSALPSLLTRRSRAGNIAESQSSDEDGGYIAPDVRETNTEEHDESVRLHAALPKLISREAQVASAGRVRELL